MSKLGITLGAAALALAATASTASAFCGFYVEGSGAKLAADATEVTLMRSGTRTVLAMQNDFKGPLNDFAMVVPVPVVLKEKDVKTLDKGVLARIDSLGSPRLVEYWEQNPCPVPRDERMYDDERAMPMMAPSASMGAGQAEKKATVKIEAQFAVGEYKILILSATEAAGLKTWLTDNGYRIPDGAEPLLRPYIEAGSKFFVAKVDPKKVKMVGDHAELSPLRFTYDSEEFALPIRLGMANSTGKQDLIVNIIADTRYEVANYKNITIPTNFDVKDSVKPRFAEFYAALFDKTMDANPGAVITEYAWDAQPYSMCDPCPPEIPTDGDAMTLGGDVIGGKIAQGTYTLTRLHARYSAKEMKDDLRFREAKPIQGGRENWNGKGLEYGATPSSTNNFQGRYAVRHWWTGPIACANPQRGVWGGPPDGNYGGTIAAPRSQLAYAKRGQLALGSVIKRDLWEIGVKKGAAPAPTPQGGGGFAKPPGTKTMAFGLGSGAIFGLLLLGLLSFFKRKK
ncbi:MAG TPA: DUF2330 domain-containing protein [Kofleriaceae bacterium]|jgi:hypothetical protein